jgi:hypothetical protein
MEAADRKTIDTSLEQLRKLHQNISPLWPADALADYDAAIGNDPRFRDAHFNRGVVHLRAGRLGPARADIEAFVRLGGKPPNSVLQALGVQRGNE